MHFTVWDRITVTLRYCLWWQRSFLLYLEVENLKLGLLLGLSFVCGLTDGWRHNNEREIEEPWTWTDSNRQSVGEIWIVARNLWHPRTRIFQFLEGGEESVDLHIVLTFPWDSNWPQAPCKTFCSRLSAPCCRLINWWCEVECECECSGRRCQVSTVKWAWLARKSAVDALTQNYTHVHRPWVITGSYFDQPKRNIVSEKTLCPLTMHVRGFHGCTDTYKHGGAMVLVLYPKTTHTNYSVYLNKTADLNRIAATDLTVQRPLHERYGDASSAYTGCPTVSAPTLFAYYSVTWRWILKIF